MLSTLLSTLELESSQSTGLTLYEAIESGNANRVKEIISNSAPDFEHICKEGFEQNLLIVARSNREILACMLALYGNKFSYADKIAGLFRAAKKGYFQDLRSELRCFDEAYPSMEYDAISFQESKKLYQAIIDKELLSNKLVQGFEKLTNVRLPYQGHEKLYQALIDKEILADKLSQGFVLLARVNISYQDNVKLYEALIDQSNNATTLADGFVFLVSADIPYKSNKKLYQLLITHASNAFFLGIGFMRLMKANIPYEGNESLYQLLTEKPTFVSLLEPAFVELTKASLPYQGNERLYQLLTDNPSLKEVQVIVQLAKADIPYQDNEKFYQSIISNANDAEKLPQVLNALLALGASYLQYPAYFTINILTAHNGLAQHVLSTLQNSGYSLEHYKSVFDSLLMELSKERTGYQALLNIVNQLKDYASKGLLMPDAPGFDAQMEDLEVIVNSSPWSSLTCGPLNKSKATMWIEVLLEQISQLEIECDELISYNTQGHYILKLPAQDEVNLSLLIKNANLSQLTLSDKLITRLDDKLRKIVTENTRKYTSINSVVNLLPKALQRAIQQYTSECYLNINKLFRSEPLVQEAKRIFNQEEDKNMLACFLLGCLLNDAVNKINVLVDNASEEMACHPGMFFDRGEMLTEETIKERVANTWSFPALTSFSIRKEGSPYFKEEGTFRTKLANPPRAAVINSAEGEVVFPQGTQVITSEVLTSEGQKYLLSEIKNSPMLDPKNHYWSELALATAHAEYLSKEYDEQSHAIMLNNHVIARPNHNITHTYRVMLSVGHVTDYFSHYAADEEFKAFCESLSDEDLEWLRVAAAFRVTGRESEISAIEDLKRYNQYKEASCKHFIAFVDKTNNAADSAMKERMSQVVRYLGNPHYETTINDHSDEAERHIRNYYHRLLSIAHEMDLPRCYSASEYTRTMKLCHDLSEPSETQQNALHEIIRYNIQLIKAQGGRLSCEIEANDIMVDKSINYQPIYGEASTSMKRLFEITQTVTKPQIRRFQVSMFGMRL